MQDDPEIRKRVKIALGLLAGAKVLNVLVPFIFKYAVDTLNTSAAVATGDAVMGLTTAPATVATVATSLLVGCKNVNILLSEIFQHLMILSDSRLIFFCRWNSASWSSGL